MLRISLHDLHNSFNGKPQATAFPSFELLPTQSPAEAPEKGLMQDR
jgi:hypothetical protein